MFKESMMWVLFSPPGVGGQCAVCLLWVCVDLVKVMPRVRNLRATRCLLKIPCGFGSECPARTLLLLVTILHYTKTNKGPWPQCSLEYKYTQSIQYSFDMTEGHWKWLMFLPSTLTSRILILHALAQISGHDFSEEVTFWLVFLRNTVYFLTHR